MTLGPVGQRLVEKLRGAFNPQHIELTDESHLHAGHAGARPEGETHFRLSIVSDAFAGRSRVERHRMINQVLADDLATRVHALAISALPPSD